MAKLSRVVLENIRGFEDIDIDLANGNSPRNWAILLGNNGTGKSTILRSIALALGDRSHAAGLLQNFNGDLVRKGSPKGRIRIELAPLPRIKTPSIDITVTPQGSREEIHAFTTVPKDDFPWDKVFVCGYGAGRGVTGTESYTRYRVSDAVYNLFEYTQPLQNSELILRRFDGIGESPMPLLGHIDNIMMLDPGSSSLSRSGIVVKGHWGQDLPLSNLGDGYQATFTWITDLLGWAMYAKGTAPLPSSLTGIVLIDEIDQHLHPIWQRRIIARIQKHFPKLQFIATTHSPIVALGTADLDDDICTILTLYFDEERRAAAVQSTAPKGQRIDQVLASALFDMVSVTDDNTQVLISEYAKLAGQQRVPTSSKKIAQIRQQLEQQLGSGSSELETIVRTAVRDAVETAFRSTLSDESLRHMLEAADFEARRQLDELTPNVERTK